ncbi:MAG: DUF3365 domain-containing protein [Flavobacteriales bacterium]|nr:DUF3365 domain-containing protein [Flavobacteriales bacterium]
MKAFSLLATAVVGIIFLAACSEDESKSSEIAFETPNTNGMRIVQNNCIVCHSPKGEVNNRIAPPMIAIKKHYLDSDNDENVFTKSLISFLKNPNESTSKMPGAVEKFGLMPKQSFTDVQLNDIADYIYNTDFEEPDWFVEHYQSEHGRSERRNGLGKEQNHLESGLNFAMKTKAILGKNLMGQINKNGTASAVEFCNGKAIHLTDSMAMEQGVAIRRVSDKARNHLNQADEYQLGILSAMKSQLSNDESISPLIRETEISAIGYYPIETNKMCLQCHGRSEDIEPVVMAKIKDLYPEDRALGYDVNELRGIWVVEMEK